MLTLGLTIGILLLVKMLQQEGTHVKWFILNYKLSESFQSSFLVVHLKLFLITCLLLIRCDDIPALWLFFPSVNLCECFEIINFLSKCFRLVHLPFFSRLVGCLRAWHIWRLALLSIRNCIYRLHQNCVISSDKFCLINYSSRNIC